jgi:hypothetical protein
LKPQSDEGVLMNGKFTVKKKLTVPISPKTHFKEKAKEDHTKEEYLNKTHVRDRSFSTRVLQAPTALGKFIGRSMSRKSFAGTYQKVITQRRNTKFMEFDLSYKKSRV